jgi:hypothetical protein
MGATENLCPEYCALACISNSANHARLVACLPPSLNWKRQEMAGSLFARSLANRPKSLLKMAARAGLHFLEGG